MKNKKIKISLLVVIILVCSVLYFCKNEIKFIAGVHTLGIVSAKDLDEADGICNFIKDNYDFVELSQDSRDKEPLYCNAGAGGGTKGPTPHTISIYYMKDKNKQNEIVNLVSDYKERNNLRPLIIKFYEEENVIKEEKSDGKVTIGRTYRDEVLLSETLIE